MAIFEERAFKAPWAFLIIALVLAIAFPVWHLGERELFWNEGNYAVAALEISSPVPEITNHGVPEPGIYPLFPLLVAGLGKFGMSMELSLRLISVVSLMALCLLVWTVCYRNGGVMAAAAGSVVMFTSIIVAEKSIEGYPQMLTCLIIFGGWQAWISAGLRRGNWNFAWVLAGLFGGLAFCNGGFTALIYFFVPLAAQRRPLTVWPKLQKPGFYFAVFTVFLFVILWMLPRWTSGYMPQVLPSADLPDLSGYFKQLLMFPIDAAFRFMPWTLLLWAPFCAALIPLDPSPVSGRFHRILFCTLFVLLWFNPETKSRDILYLMPLVAVMLGMNYRILARRYGFRMLRLFALTGVLLFLAGTGALMYLLFPDFIEKYASFATGGITLELGTSRWVYSIVESSLAIFMALVALILCRFRRNIWLICSILFCGMMLVYWALVNPYKAQDHSKSELGNYFRTILIEKEKLDPASATIYKSPALSGLFAESAYMGFPLRTARVETIGADSADTVYLLCVQAPILPERNWTRIGDRIYKHEQRLSLYKGVLIREY